jgi:hypothetical protein
MLKWSKANAKTKSLAPVPTLQSYLQNKRKIYSLDLLSGWSCPMAVNCLSKVVKGKIVDGKFTKFRCFSASQEALYPNTFNARKHNFDLLRACKSSDDMLQLFLASMPKNLGICRIHVGGDFFNRMYLLAWLSLAELHPDRLFYAYTKSLPYWLQYRDYIDSLPNFVMTASYGGRHDSLISQENLRSATVVFSRSQAASMGLEIDHDDSHAADPSKKGESFALLIHGTQPAGSEAADALKALRKNKVKHSYAR